MDSETGLAYRATVVDSRYGPRRLLVVEPTRAIRVDGARIARLQGGDEGSAVDDEIVARATGWPDPIHVVVFRGQSGQPASWGFAEDLSPADRQVVGYLMVRSQLSLYRRLVDAGILALVGVEMGELELELFAAGADQLSKELDAQSRGEGPEAASARLNLWLLDHVALWTSHDLELVVGDRLPRIFSLVERRGRELEALRDAASA